VEPAVPPVRYVAVGDVQIAYQVAGDGPIDILLHPGWPTHLQVLWEHPAVVRFYRRLASFSRLILFDRRGTGLSERGSEFHRFEQNMDDMRAILDTIGSDRCGLIGCSIGGRVALLFAATYPERTSAVATIAGHPTTFRDDDYPWGTTPEQLEGVIQTIRSGWGSGETSGDLLRVLAPSVADDVMSGEWWLRLMRSAMTPGEVIEDIHAMTGVDIRGILSTVHVPTLLLHRTDDRMANIEASRYMADRIPGARFVELPGADELPYFGQDQLLDELEEFFTGVRPAVEPDRVLATVLFTDIVGSTVRAAELGDRRWRELLDTHHTLVRRELARFNGREVDTAGDGFFATFDGPARAVRCAMGAIEAIRSIGLEIRAGVHTGEVQVAGDDVSGIGVHLGARVGALAGTGEVLVSQTVKDLVAGSGIVFEDRGTHTLKGVPDEWRLFRVVSA
jgi:pimeloyl-ACP methyl ester carboxylesterase